MARTLARTQMGDALLSALANVGKQNDSQNKPKSQMKAPREDPFHKKIRQAAERSEIERIKSKKNARASHPRNRPQTQRAPHAAKKRVPEPA